jgi:transposase
MDFERATMAQVTEIQRLIEAGQSDRQIGRALHCRRLQAAAVRKGLLSLDAIANAKKQERRLPPTWALQVDWEQIEKDIRGGHELKRMWEESVSSWTSYSNFFKYTKARFALLLGATVTLREFNAGEHCEVDYAGDRIEWIDFRGEVHEAHVFLGILSFSQLIFSWAAPDEKKLNWLESHRKMFEFYGGVPKVVVCDQLKNGVIKSHRYDPDLNPDYVALASHYGTVIVPARVRHPKDKSLVEGAVKLLMRYFRFVYRRRTFTSILEINRALTSAGEKINSRAHTRFKISRLARFEELEKKILISLPLEPYEQADWRTATLHPDCTVAAPDKNFYSAPHIYRGKELRVKMTPNHVEVFIDLERIALHPRAKGKIGERVIENTHLTENSRAYRETTPQLLLSQARFIHIDLHGLIDEMFKADTLGNLRRAQGFIRKAHVTVQAHGKTTADPWITRAIESMRRFGRIRVRTFEEFIKSEMKKCIPQEDRTITRLPGNPMVRGHGTREPEEDQM